MRHQKAGFKLSRNHHERQSLFKNLIRALILNDGLVTTVAKAKAIKPLVDKIIVKAKTGTLANRRLISQTLVDKAVVTKLFDDIAQRNKSRTSGFTRMHRAFRRLGDDTQMVKVEFVDPKVEVKKEAKPVKEEAKKEKSGKKINKK